MKNKVGLIFIGFILLIYGFGIGRYKWVPYRQVYALKNMLSPNKASTKPNNLVYQGADGILKEVFIDKVIHGDLIKQPIRTFEDVYGANDSIFIYSKDFTSAYEQIQIKRVEQFRLNHDSTNVVKITFQYQMKEHAAFAYGTLPNDNIKSAGCLIIPGSGLNQSTGIYNNDTANYHFGIIDALKQAGISQIYALIKPNEDILAWHDGQGHKVDGNYIWNWHLNRSGSYSVSYLVQSLAFAKWMKSKHDKTVVAGLSQGGIATLINAIQSQPTCAIVASGYSVLFRDLEGAGHDQIIGVPGYSNLFDKDTIYSTLKESPTQWFFSWGKNETNIYKMEAEEKITAKVIDTLKNVSIAIHPDGHIFPKQPIRTFIEQLNLKV